MNIQLSANQKSLLAVAVVALLLRVTVRLLSGAADFWDNGYTFYFTLSRNIAAGNGLAADESLHDPPRFPEFPGLLACVMFAWQRCDPPPGYECSRSTLVDSRSAQR